ncbi:MAG TPA: FAD-binding protein, partial [Candidatus Nitrosocosmicus sp.]|nr:FAD-binding protein [Candidatus Nitrosocosmicus sp.]
MRPIAEGLRPLVKGRVLESSEVEPERTTNFGHVFTARPGAVLEPAHAEDVAAAIRFARGEGIPVSVRGAAHSQSQIAISNGGLLIDMRSMGRIGAVAKGAVSVEVEGGAIWRDLTRSTLKHLLAPPVLTNNLSVTVGGTLSTAGVGVASHRYGTQGDQVEELTVVTGAG